MPKNLTLAAPYIELINTVSCVNPHEKSPPVAAPHLGKI